MSATVTSPPLRRRWFQFRLRTLFVVTALVAVLSAIGAEAFERYQAWQWERRFDELMELLEETVHPVSTTLREESAALEPEENMPKSQKTVQD